MFIGWGEGSGYFQDLDKVVDEIVSTQAPPDAANGDAKAYLALCDQEKLDSADALALAQIARAAHPSRDSTAGATLRDECGRAMRDQRPTIRRIPFVMSTPSGPLVPNSAPCTLIPNPTKPLLFGTLTVSDHTPDASVPIG
jgi:hypothetical protein